MFGILQVKGGCGGFQNLFPIFVERLMRNRSAIHKGHIAFASPLCLGRQPVQTFGTTTVAITGVLSGLILAFVIFIAWVFSIDA